jgi:hypothetical protein
MMMSAFYQNDAYVDCYSASALKKLYKCRPTRTHYPESELVFDVTNFTDSPRIFRNIQCKPLYTEYRRSLVRATIGSNQGYNIVLIASPLSMQYQGVTSKTSSDSGGQVDLL